MTMNRVILLGRLGNAPELRNTQNGKVVGHFSLATDRWRGEGQEPETDWHRIVVWEKTAEACSRYLEKGRMVGVEGRIQNRRWKGDDGENRYTTEVIADRVHFLPGRRNDSTEERPTRLLDPRSAHEEEATEPDDLPF